MPLEKPIQTIRKAVEEKATTDAAKEFYEKPQPEHYKKVFEQFKSYRELSPDMLEKLIEALAETRDIKIEMGSELYSIFDRVTREVMATQDEKIGKAMDKILSSTKTNSEKMKEVSDLLIRVMDSVDQEIKTNPQIVAAFSGKEHLMDKASANTKKLLPALFQGIAKAQELI